MKKSPLTTVLPPVLLAALCSAGLNTGCSLEVSPPSEEEEEELPPLLEFEAPYEGVVYTEADDAQPELPGVELAVRVLVRDLENDVWLEDLALAVHEGSGRQPASRAPVHVDLRGQRCAELPFTFFPRDEPQTFTVVAKAGGLAVIEREITIAAAP
jgi:hypothetical protein